jgi:hypothetical protein
MGASIIVHLNELIADCSSIQHSLDVVYVSLTRQYASIYRNQVGSSIPADASPHHS